MPVRTWLVLIAVGAALHGVFFAFYQRPEWTTVADQEGYRRLGRSLAEHGTFTRYPEEPHFVPEVLRTPGYPLFLAAIYRVFGPSNAAVAVAQTAVFVLLTLIVYGIARACAPPGTALVAAALTALYPTFPYFAALTMTELWTTFVLTAGAALLVRAHRTGTRGSYVAAGVVLGYAALCRPAFVLLPFAFVACGVLLFRRESPRLLRGWAWVLAAFALTLLPWFAFNYHVMQRFALAPAGGVGRGLWEGTWHGRWPGRVQNELTQLAVNEQDPAALDAQVNAFAARGGYDPGPMLVYVHQWKQIRRIWDDPVDPLERAWARIRADDEYRRVALENIRTDPAGHVWRRLTYGAFVLWNADIWLRYSEINDAPTLLIRAMWSVQVVLLLLAVHGVFVLLRSHQRVHAWLLTTPLLYVTAVHLPLLTEARQSLPVKPLLLVLAGIAIADLASRLFALEPQVHEREHV